ncbi:CMP-sialic acid transporter 4 [Castilleja foliolosa]|uniref:CMP-sialic acid transporter 4 n=1 Tax=Castilleja foliolosa TaxID=1961234 RepID=A0ABD3EMU9_9LAMI
MKSGMIECSVCHSKLVNPATKAVSRAYDRHRIKVSSKQRALNFLLVGGDCVLVGLQPILVFMSKVDGRFKFSPISVNFLIEVAKVIFAIVMLIFQMVLFLQSRRQKVGEKPLLSVSTFIQNGQNMDDSYDFQKCIGLKVKPHKGDGLLFYSLYPNGTIDPTSLHGSCPVIKGENWVATKRIRNQDQDEKID